MSTVDECPILIPSEDEFEDGEEVQYIKEEKAPPITIDETEDQDDVIFVSTCPPPTPALPPTWDDTLAIADMDLGTFSCSTPLTDLPDIMADSLPPTVAVGSTDMPALTSSDYSSVDSSSKLTVSDTDLSLGVGTPDLAVGNSVSSLVSSGSVSTLSGLQLVPVTHPDSTTPALTSMPVVSNVNVTAATGNLSLLPDASPGKAMVSSGSSLSQPTSSFLPTAGPLDLSPPDKVPKQQRKKKASRKNLQLNVLHTDSSSSSSSDSSCDGGLGDMSSEGELSDGESKMDSYGVMGTASKISFPHSCPTSKPGFSCLNGSQSMTVVNPLCSGGATAPSLSCSTSSAGISPSVTHSNLSQGISPITKVAGVYPSKNIPPSSGAGTCLSDMTSWLDLALSSDTHGNPASNTNIAQPFSGTAAAMQSADKSMSKFRTGNCSDSSVILPTQSVGATSTIPAQMSFISSDITQPSSSQSTSQIDRLSSTSDSVRNSYPKPCPNPPLSQTQTQQLSALQSGSKTFTSSTVLQQNVSQLQPAQQVTQAMQKQQQASSSKETDLSSSDFFDKLLGQPQQGSNSTSMGPNLDFLDKLLGDCNSILSSDPMSTPPVLLPPVSSAASSSTDAVNASAVTSMCSPSVSSAQDCVSTVSDKTVKRPSSSSLTALSNSSLPPRKRVRPPLSAPFTPSSTSAFTALFDQETKQASSCGSSQNSADASKPALLARSTSYPSADQRGSSQLNQPSGAGDIAASQPSSGSSSLAVPSTSGTSQGAASDANMAVSGVSLCVKCRAKDGEKISDGEVCKLSLCPIGHAACGSCLMVQAGRVLSNKSKQKETLQCIAVNCGNFYTISELKNSLPLVIVEILQERLDQDFIEIIDNMMTNKDDDRGSNKKMPSNKNKRYGHSKRHRYSRRTSSDVDDQNDDSSYERNDTDDNMAAFLNCEYDSFSKSDNFQNEFKSSNGKNDQQNEFPEHWSKMDNSKYSKTKKEPGLFVFFTRNIVLRFRKRGKNLVEVVGVLLEPDSDEYINVAVRFHENMRFPDADITRIVRIQNPYLWKAYALKKEKMIQENDQMAVNEFQLFHGTKSNTVEAICRRGFDWRFCGKHGTAYGHGCYFAGDSYYSNTYTDRGNTSTAGADFLKSIIQMNPIQGPSSSSGVVPTPQPPPRGALQQAQRSVPPLPGPSAPAIPPNSKSAFFMKKVLPLLKNGRHNPQTLLAELLKQKTQKHMIKHVLSSPASLTSPGTSIQSQQGPQVGQSHMTFSQSLASSPRPQHAHSQPSSQLQHQLYQYGRYSRLAGSKKLPPSAACPAQPNHRTSAAGLSSSVHPPPLPPPPVGSSQGQKSHSPFVPASKPNFLGVHVARASSFSSGPLPSNKVPIARSSASSSQLMPGQQGGLMVPISNYQSGLAVATTAVTLSGASAAHPLALLAANTGSSTPGSSYLLVAPLPTQPSIPPTLGALHPAQPPPNQLLGQPPPPHASSLPPKPSPWPGAQALDLRKSGPAPRYIFLAKVLAGRYTGGQPQYRRPPPLDNSDPLGRCYDSCVDNIYTPRIWVTFDSTQAYPEYAIEYIVNVEM